MSENPRMPLTGRGIAYVFVLVAGALDSAFLGIRTLGIFDANLQYNVAISIIVLFIGIFFCRDNILVGSGRRTFWSAIFAAVVFALLYFIDAA